ncbi:MAG: site-specific DNA-methyltransferase [Blastomonas fulva]|uniref:site-specific DNA-methyltransferase n=1 Tax=Blastomonas fulva TaxID=1550728 RepID=UPI004033AF44
MRFHSGWLYMNYTGLFFAIELLDEDGVIAVSLNDGEMPALRGCMNEIFGEHNFIASLIWKSRQNKDNRSINGASVDHEYVVCFGGRLRGDERVEGQYSNTDNDPRGPWTSANMVGLATADRRPNLHYDLIDPETGYNYGCPPLGWRYEPTTMTRLIAEGVILWPKEPTGRPRRKAYLADVGSEFTGYSSVIGKDTFTRDGTADISKLFDVRIFDFPKPVGLLQEIIVQAGGPNGLVLDFFAGSGTTGHAVMAQNAVDGGDRRFILVQLPEPLNSKRPEQKTAADFCDRLGKPRNIAELTKERLRRAGAKMQADHAKAKFDIGFRVYKLATSNLKPWQPGDDLVADLLDATTNVLPGRSEDDLLVELLLKTGIDLALPSTARTIAGRIVHMFGGGTLVVCLADIAADDARALGDAIADWLTEVSPPDKTTFFFKDSGFDAGGNRAAEARCNLAAALRQRLGNEAIEKLGAI